LEQTADPKRPLAPKASPARNWLVLIWPTALSWWPELLLGAVALCMVLADGFRNYPGDPTVFYNYATQISQGNIPYLDFPFEYPPLTIVSLMLPWLMSGGAPSIETYRFLLFFQNVGLAIGIGIGVSWLARRGSSVESPLRSAVLYGLLTLALVPVLVWRLDTVVAALTVVALIAAASRRWAASGIALGAGVMTKLYPLALLPVLALGPIVERRWRPAILVAGACVATVLVIAAALFFIAGPSALYFVGYATNRGVQIESVLGGLALLAAALGGPRAQIGPGFGTFQVDSTLLPALAVLGTVIIVAGVIALGLAMWHRFRADRRSFGAVRPSSQAAYALAALLLVLATSRILSPQYLFWMVPFAALVSRPKALALLCACLLTTCVYPLHYQEFLNQERSMIAAVNVRNALLLVVFAWQIWPDLGLAIRELLPRVRALVARVRRGAPKAPSS
jgi:uncharacterized membrane protein YidH (DUF202 family)